MDRKKLEEVINSEFELAIDLAVNYLFYNKNIFTKIFWKKYKNKILFNDFENA